MSDLLDLDGLMNQMPEPKPEEKIEIGDSVDLAPVEKKQVDIPKPQSLEDVFDRFLKRVYLFDISGSMRAPIISDETINSFEWGQYTLDGIRRDIINARAAVQEAETKIQAGLAQPGAVLADLVDAVTLKLAEADPALDTDDDRLKVWVIEQQLWRNFNLSPKPGVVLKKRIDLVVTSAKALISKRFEKYPDADVVGIWFTNAAGVLSDNCFAHTGQVQHLRKLSKEQLLAAIDQLPPQCNGGTDIQNALQTGLNIVEKAPSVMQMHHFILVTDAEDYTGAMCLELLPKFKEKGVVLDFIHLTDPYIKKTWWGNYDENAMALKKLCDETGGEYTRVTSVKDFEIKFIQASSRLLLPPGSK